MFSNLSFSSINLPIDMEKESKAKRNKYGHFDKIKLGVDTNC